MKSAIAAVGSGHNVEANQLDIVAGVPRITVRFTVEEAMYDDGNHQALRAAANMRHAVEEVAVVRRPLVLRLHRGKWVKV